MGGGQPPSTEQKTFLELRFGVDFRSVRLHTDGVADIVARSMRAYAYTQGSDIVFREVSIVRTPTRGVSCLRVLPVELRSLGNSRPGGVGGAEAEARGSQTRLT